MSLHLYKNEDGNIYQATAGEPVSREHLQEEHDKATVELRKWATALAEYDRLAGTPAAPDTPSIESVEDDEGHVTFSKVAI